jgi:hypothetical protein
MDEIESEAVVVVDQDDHRARHLPVFIAGSGS